MLTKSDLKAIKDISVNTIGEFFEKVLAPYLDDKFGENDKAHKGILGQLDQHDKDFDTVFRKLEKNEDQHDRIYEKLDEIDEHLQNHEKRIKKLETVIIPN